MSAAQKNGGAKQEGYLLATLLLANSMRNSVHHFKKQLALACLRLFAFCFVQKEMERNLAYSLIAAERCSNAQYPLSLSDDRFHENPGTQAETLWRLCLSHGKNVLALEFGVTRARCNAHVRLE